MKKVSTKEGKNKIRKEGVDSFEIQLVSRTVLFTITALPRIVVLATKVH